MKYYDNNKKALNDLISDLENDNGILLIAKEDVESELEYAEKCHNLEEELGCPLEIVFKALIYGIWYENVANEMNIASVNLNTHNYGCDFVLENYNNDVSFLTRNYKKTWWLKEDKSE